MNSDSFNQAIVLFDEQGTPTFPDRETDSFLGIAVIYNLSDEENIFYQCNKIFGLSNTKPLRNNKISNSRIIHITNLIKQLPIQIVISSLDLSNSEFQKVVKSFEEFSNLMRDKHRDVRERPMAHILHSQILDDCMFKLISNFAIRNQMNNNFSLFIDNWSIPKSDVDIYLEQRSQSFESKINGLLQQINFPFQINVPSITLLNEDNLRKRFIGVIASVISRSFKKHDDERYSEYPLESLTDIESNIYCEITRETMEILIGIMHDN